MNRWNIPDWMERKVIERDRSCIYCGIEFSSSSLSKKSQPTWEHIVNNEKIITLENIARCCSSCNASKGAKDLSVWLKSSYCIRLGITENTVAEVVQNALTNPPTLQGYPNKSG